MKKIFEVRAKPQRKEKVLFFGEGNFLRAFAAVAVQRMNERAGFDGDIVLLQGLEKGIGELINAQKGLYTIIEQGAKNGRPVERFSVIDSVSRCVNPYTDYGQYLKIAESPDLELIVSNTTEFGICFDESESSGVTVHRNFPAKLTDFLYRRFSHFEGADGSGLIILPCELIENNGKKLKEYVLRYAEVKNLGSAFYKWLENEVVFADTLVDRIVSGYPREQSASFCEKLGYADDLLDVCEPFFLWVIETRDKRIKTLPLAQCGLDIIVTDDLKPYRNRKVRILNGAHTASVPAAILCGLENVEQVVLDPDFAAYLKKCIFEEIIPSFEGEGREKFAADVLERFHNPFIDHRLRSIALNSISKFKARVLPSIADYTAKFGKAPKALSFSFAALYAFYKSGSAAISDDAEVLSEISKADTLQKFMQSTALWGEDLTRISGFLPEAESALDLIRGGGMKKAIGNIAND